MRFIASLICASSLWAPACAPEPLDRAEPASTKVSALDVAPVGPFSMLPLYATENNPSGFVDGTGRPVWLSGMIIDSKANGWPLIDDATLKRIHDNAGNYAHIRLGPFVRWYEGKDFEAYLYNENEQVYDLNHWNEPFWERVRHVLDSAEKLGIYVEVDVVDGWTMKPHPDQPEQRISPWQAGNNLNEAAYDCDNMLPREHNYHTPWLQKVADVTGEFPNVIYQVGNETHNCGDMGRVPWESTVVSTVLERLPEQRMFSTNSDNLAIENADWINYVNRHRHDYPDAQPLVWNKPGGINEYGESTDSSYTTEVWFGFVQGTYLHYWAGPNIGDTQDKTLAAVQFFQSIVNKTDFRHFTPRPIEDQRLVGNPDWDYVGYFKPEKPPTLHIEHLARPSYDVRWYDAMARQLKLAEVHTGGPPDFTRPEPGKTWVLHVNAHELTDGMWLKERFDDLDNGPLHGQHRWSRIDDSPRVEGDVAKVVAIHAGTGTVAIDKDVPIQTAGKHRLDVRVRVLDNTTPTMAKLEVDTLASAVSPVDNKKFQLYFGGDRFRINRYTGRDMEIPLPGGVQLGHWYDIRCDIDLDRNSVAIYVDGALAVPAYTMNAGPITDVQLMGFPFGPAGSVEIDDLRAGPVRFYDVPPWHPFYNAIEILARNGITAGCGPDLFCPDAALTRAELAVFTLRAKHGPFWLPPAPHGIFADVPAGDPFAPWIEGLYAEGVIGSCSEIALLYCPTSSSSRAEMADYLLRAKHSGTYQPPAPEYFFVDVSHRDPHVAWIDQLRREQITSGCDVNPLRYCPALAVSRGQMAAFVDVAFALR